MMKHLLIFSITFLLLLQMRSIAQNVGINDDGSNPDNSAMLDVKSADKGILIPRVDFNNLPLTPATGLLVYVTANGPNGNNAFYYYDGSQWQKIEGGSTTSTIATDLLKTSGNMTITNSDNTSGNGNISLTTGTNGFIQLNSKFHVGQDANGPWFKLLNPANDAPLLTADQEFGNSGYSLKVNNNDGDFRAGLGYNPDLGFWMSGVHGSSGYLAGAMTDGTITAKLSVWGLDGIPTEMFYANQLGDIYSKGNLEILGNTQLNGSLTLGNFLLGNTYTFPLNRGSNGQLLTTDADGNLSWTTISTSDNILNGGNSFGGNILIGSNDAHALHLVTDGSSRLYFSETGLLTIPSFNSAGVLLNNSSGLISSSIGTNGQVLGTNASGEPEWQTPYTGLTNFTESNYSYDSKYGVKLLAQNDAQTNVDFVISPKGNGGILAQQPDGMISGGNKRGLHAVDLQTIRGIADQVASGNNSVIIGGGGNKASGDFSFAMGNQSTASGYGSVALGVQSSAGSQNSVGLGGGNASGWYATAIGSLITASGSYSFASGYRNTAQSYAETVIGVNATVGSGNVDEFIDTDRLFVVGNGASSSNKRNALTILKNANTTIGGSLTINGNGTNTSYLFPETRGTSGQVMKTNADGTTSWTTPYSGLTNFTESNYTYDAKTGVKLLANNAGANVDVVLQPKGEGAILAQQPDGTVAGGNNRGALAVDLQTLRESNTQVASGRASVIAGGWDNEVAGTGSAIMGGGKNTINGDYNSIGGGRTNNSEANYSVVAGGYANNAGGEYSSISGGRSNTTATANYTAIGGGYSNTASGYASTIAGGRSNTASGDLSFVGGGDGNTAQSYGESALGLYSTVGTGNATIYVATDRLFVLGNGTGDAGRSNALTILKNANTTIGGSLTLNGNGTNTSLTFPAVRGTSGQVLKTNADGTTSWTTPYSGLTNFTESNYTYDAKTGVKLFANNAGANVDVVLQPKGEGAILAHQPDGTAAGGNNRGALAVDLQTLRESNTQVASGRASVIAGGWNNEVAGTGSAILGGGKNTIDGEYNSIGGGRNNNSEANYSVVAGGYGNQGSGDYSVVSGGYGNEAKYLAFVGGGTYNVANGNYSSVSGGRSNTTSTAFYTAIGGGYSNTAGGYASTISGGRSNTASGDLSFVGGGDGNTAQSYGESVLGLFATVGTGDNDTYVATDRLFVLGNGTADAARRNALTILKNANTTIGGSLTLNGNGTNTSLTFPTNRGTSGQVLRTDGSGGTSWQTPANGTVTSVTGTAPISVATGTTTPVVSIAAATSSAAGSMSAVDKTKLDGLVSSQWTTSDANIYYNSGNVGIGNTTPRAPLEFSNSIANRKIVFYTTADNDHQFTGFGLNGDALRFQLGNTTGNFKFYGATSATTSDELFRIEGDGDIVAQGQIKNVSSPTDAQDAATKNYVDNRAKTYEIGDFAQGGIVFWLDESGQHGLVCAKEDQSTAARWSAGYITNTMAKGDGPLSGEMNTAIIIANQGYGDGTTYAARICNELQITENGKTYGDWYLPSIQEINLMYENRTAINTTATLNGGSSFAADYYWSSKEINSETAEVRHFSSGFLSNRNKINTASVRAIRTF